MRCLIGSQCNFLSIDVMCSDFDVFVTTRARVFCMRCILFKLACDSVWYLCFTSWHKNYLTFHHIMNASWCPNNNIIHFALFICSNWYFNILNFKIFLTCRKSHYNRKSLGTHWISVYVSARGQGRLHNALEIKGMKNAP